MIGRWMRAEDGVSPGGTPAYVCGQCKESYHLHGAEYQKRKVVCDVCGRINIYPFEHAYEEESSIWQNDDS